VPDWSDQEQFSIAFVTAVAAAAGYSCVPTPRAMDNAGLDLAVFDRTVPDPFPQLYLQVKSKQVARIPSGQSVSLDLARHQYEQLRRGSRGIPCLLVLVLVPPERRQWLRMTPAEMTLKRSAFWTSLQGAPTSGNQSTVRIHLPLSQMFGPAELRGIMNKAGEGGR
jgi:hypothetical protein